MDNSTSEHASKPTIMPAVIVHYTLDAITEGTTITTLCGETTVIQSSEDTDPTTHDDRIVCALCAGAWELKDIPIPHLEQGELFS